MAEVLTGLMSRLGYERYGVHGYDTGALVGPAMARLAPERVTGVHVNGLLTFPIGEEGELDELPPADQRRWQAMLDFNDGYLQCNSKRPQTVTYALHDSPAGQLAWIVEKFKELTEPEEALPEECVDRDRILTDVSLYWFTGTAGSAAQIYYEEAEAWGDAGEADGWGAAQRGTVPTAVLVSAHDVTIRRWAERDHNIVRWTEPGRGGHFLAMEQPALLIDDLRAFFRKDH